MSSPVSDKVYLGSGAVLFAAACAWAFLQQGELDKHSRTVNAPSTGPAYSPAELPAANISEALPWPQAVSMPRGAQWVYDVFTPPVIYYNTETKQFTVTRPVVEPVGPIVVNPNPPFGAHLVKVVQYPFPLQLVGYIGTGDQARGTFQNMLTNETLLGSTGKKIPELNLEILAFKSEVVRTIVDNQPVVYTVASAKVRDTKTGREVELSNTKRLIESEPSVFIQIDGEASPRELKSGDSFTVGDYTYKVDSIQAEPPSVNVTKSGGELKEPESKTLQPEVAPAPAAGDVPADAPVAPIPAGVFPGF